MCPLNTPILCRSCPQWYCDNKKNIKKICLVVPFQSNDIITCVHKFLKNDQDDYAESG